MPEDQADKAARMMQDESAVDRDESRILEVANADGKGNGKPWVPVCAPGEAKWRQSG